MNNDLMKEAKRYAERGWQVFPLHSARGGRCSCKRADCTSVGKHPRTRSGMKEATTDLAKIQEWWQSWPDANIGIRTGRESGIVVVDLDNGDDKRGEANFKRLAASEGEAVTTLAARTGRGRHLFFQYPNFTVKNSAGSIAAGVDMRGDGGYVVAAPSIHQTGTQYAWENSEQAIAELPDWLQARMAEGAKPSRAESSAIASIPEVIPEGIRNHTLYRLGCSLRGQLAMDYTEISQRLLLYNQAKCIPPLSEDEVLRIAASSCAFAPENAARSLRRTERNPLYWLKLNARDFFADQNIQAMKDNQLGWYIKLRLSAWQNGGTLPADPEKLWRLAGARSRRSFEKDCALVLASYERVTLGGEERLIDRELAAQYAETLDKWLIKKAAGEANRDRLRMGPFQTFDESQRLAVQ